MKKTHNRCPCDGKVRSLRVNSIFTIEIKRCLAVGSNPDHI